MIFSLGAFEKAKLDEARYLFKMTVARTPNVLLEGGRLAANSATGSPKVAREPPISRTAFTPAHRRAGALLAMPLFVEALRLARSASLRASLAHSADARIELP
jgi:hypothetical protein